MPHSTESDGTDLVTITLGFVGITGSIRHDDTHRLLVLETDEGSVRLSTDLRGHGLTPRPGHVFVKNWSEHSGLAIRLEAAGLVKPVRIFSIGPFDSVFEVEVTL